ncbi:MAG: AAA family ATPase [Syntrophales bacterium LBB04]|nr:AAA family ATPase [Syntrophales bacterium LBB04]
MNVFTNLTLGDLGVFVGHMVDDIGCGKTMLAKALCSQLPPNQYQIVTMSNPALEPLDFLRMVLMLFNVQCGNGDDVSKAKMLYTLEFHLRKDLDAGKQSVLIVDEAQTIREAHTLDELRMLLNLQSSTHFLINLILLGQNELEPLVASCPPLLQRMAVRYRLDHLSATDTAKYIQHRVIIAGATVIPFTFEAIEKIHHYTNGIPREINNLCDRALLAASLKEEPMVDTPNVEEAWHDIQS